jgi:hypothetical protein
LYNGGTYSDDGGGEDDKQIFVCECMCAVWTFMITGDENVGSAVTNPKGQFRLHITKN